VAPGTDVAALGVDRAKRLAGVLEQAEVVLGRQRLQLRHRRRVAEDVDRQDPGGALTDGGGRGRRVEVERDRVDVAEDRLDALIEQAVGGGDEAEGTGQNLVAGSPAKRSHAEVQPGRAAGYRDRVLDPEPIGEGALEALAHRPQREPARAQHLERELLLAGADLRPGQRDRLAHCPWNA
jgi:hypothetical protein